MLDKQALRKQLKNIRGNIPEEILVNNSEQIFALLIKEQAYLNSNCLGIYWQQANSGEIQTTKIIQHALNHNKTVCLPKIDAASQELIFKKFASLADQTEINQFDIVEPTTNSPTIPLAEISILIVPIVAFTRNGNRLGQGGGYYDRILANIEEQQLSTKVIALAHSIQEVPKIPLEPWDKNVDMIITEKETIRIM